MPPSGILTLLTDFGVADAYVAAMKGASVGRPWHWRISSASLRLRFAPPYHLGFVDGRDHLLATPPPRAAHPKVVSHARPNTSSRPLRLELLMGRRVASTSDEPSRSPRPESTSTSPRAAQTPNRTPSAHR